MNSKERIIDLRQYFIYLCEKFYIIIFVAAIAACALGYKDYKRQRNGSGAIANLGVIVNQNRNAYYQNSRDYTDANRPANTVESRVKLYVDFDLEGYFISDKIDKNNIVTQLSTDACALCVSESAMQEIIDELQLNTTYDDMKNITASDLSWMVNKNLMGAHVMIIVVTDVNAQRAHDIAEAVANKFMENAIEYGLAKEVRFIDEASLPKDIVVGNYVLDKKAIIKKFIVGGVLGAVMAAVILLIAFIIKDAVRTENDIEFVGQKNYGRISLRQRYFVEDMKRLAVSLDQPDSGKIITLAPVDKYALKKEIAGEIENAFSVVNKKVSVVSTIEDGIADKSKLTKLSGKSDYVIIITQDMEKSADALIAAKNSDSVILMARYGKSRVQTLKNATREMLKTGTNVKGVVVVKK